jgi:hypothetical protein
MVHKFTFFSFLWATWKAEETLSPAVNKQGLYENPVSHFPMDKPKGGGISLYFSGYIFLTCMKPLLVVSYEFILLALLYYYSHASSIVSFSLLTSELEFILLS